MSSYKTKTVDLSPLKSDLKHHKTTKFQSNLRFLPISRNLTHSRLDYLPFQAQYALFADNRETCQAVRTPSPSPPAVSGWRWKTVGCWGTSGGFSHLSQSAGIWVWVRGKEIEHQVTLLLFHISVRKLSQIVHFINAWRDVIKKDLM